MTNAALEAPVYATFGVTARIQRVAEEVDHVRVLWRIDHRISSTP